MQLNGKVAIVTGGAQGIGKAIVKEFLQYGAAVVCVDIDEEAGKEIEQEFNSSGKVKFILANNSKEDEVKQVVNQTLTHFNRIDFLINNAGIFIGKKSIEQLTLAEWNQVIGTNLTGAFLFAKYCTPHLKKNQGSIINIASTRAFMSEADTEAYSASKGGIVALTHALAISLGPEIHVNCISPGWIETSEWKKSSLRKPAKHSAADKAQHPVGRVGKPEDIASLIIYLVSQQNSFITGANFIVDGGMTRKMIYV